MKLKGNVSEEEAKPLGDDNENEDEALSYGFQY